MAKQVALRRKYGKWGGGKSLSEKFCFQSSLFAIILLFFLVKILREWRGGRGGKKYKKKLLLNADLVGPRKPIQSCPANHHLAADSSAFQHSAWCVRGGRRVLTQDLFLGYVAKCAQTNGSKGTEADWAEEKWNKTKNKIFSHFQPPPSCRPMPQWENLTRTNAQNWHIHTHTHTHIHTTLASATPSPPPGLLSQRQRSSNQILGSLTLHAGAMAAFIDIENISSTQKN